MTKKVDTWMPLLVDKYLGDTMLLSTEQHGAYLLLLMTMWKQGGRLPNNDQQLAAAAKLPAAKWRAMRPILVDGVLLREEAGFIVQKRLTAELARARAHTDAKAEAGAKGAAARWQKPPEDDGETDGTANGKAIADAWHKVSQTGASIPIPLLKHPTDASAVPPSDDGGGDRQGAEPPGCPHEQIIAAFHEVLPMGRRVMDWTPARSQVLRTRWRESQKRQSLDWWQRFFAYCAKSPFLTGQVTTPGRKPFRVSLDWLVKSENFVKVREGAYHERQEEAA